MADDQQTYTYPDTSGTEEYSKSSASGGTENIKSIVTNKRVLTLIGILALMVFFMFRKSGSTSFDSAQDDAPPVQKVTAPETVAPLMPKPPMPIAVAPPAAPVQMAAPEPSAHSVKMATSMSALESRMSDVQSQQQDIDAGYHELLSKVDKISSYIEEQEQAAMKAKEDAKKSMITRTPPLHFSLQALVDGRAWIMGSGKTLTIVEGDKILSYGHVTHIDALNGWVETSSGRKIVFSQSDA